MATPQTLNNYYRKQPVKKSATAGLLDGVVIERGVPLPDDNRRSHSTISTRHIINKMRSGDSVVVNTKSRQGSFTAMFRNMGIKYVSRSQGDGTFRIWRL